MAQEIARRAIVIGAGLGGLSVALALQQIGVEVAVYERVPQIKAVGAGISLWPNAMKALDQLGVGERLRPLGMAEIEGGFHSPSGRTLMATDIQEAKRRFGAPTIVIRRAHLNDILLESFKGSLHLNKVFTRHEEHATAHNATEVTAHFADGTQASADLLICADGIHSVLRQSWFPNSQPRYAGYTAWRGVAAFDHQQIGKHWGETLGCGIRFGMAPLSEGHIYWFATQNLPEKTRIAPEDQQAHLLAQFGAWYDPIPTLIRATPYAHILQNDIYDINPLREWVRGRVALLGDSAHAMTPNLGQGGCQAIEDAVVLGKCLREASTVAEGTVAGGLLAYQRQRLPHANHVLQMSRRIGQIITQANPIVCALRDTLFSLTPAQAQLRNLQGIVGHEV